VLGVGGRGKTVAGSLKMQLPRFAAQVGAALIGKASVGLDVRSVARCTPREPWC
jgi:hypothetical protein